MPQAPASQCGMLLPYAKQRLHLKECRLFPRAPALQMRFADLPSIRPENHVDFRGHRLPPFRFRRRNTVEEFPQRQRQPERQLFFRQPTSLGVGNSRDIMIRENVTSSSGRTYNPSCRKTSAMRPAGAPCSSTPVERNTSGSRKRWLHRNRFRLRAAARRQKTTSRWDRDGRPRRLLSASDKSAAAPHAIATRTTSTHTETYRCDIHRAPKTPPTRSRSEANTAPPLGSPCSDPAARRRTIPLSIPTKLWRRMRIDKRSNGSCFRSCLGHSIELSRQYG